MRTRSLVGVLAVLFALPALAAPPASPGPPSSSDLEDRLAALEELVESLQQQLDVHLANASAHHARYADSEAVGAVGPHFSGNHADLANVTAAQHHAAFSGSHSDLTNVTSGQHHPPFSGSHADLTNVSSTQHHPPFSGSHDDLIDVTSSQHHVAFGGSHDDLTGIGPDQHHVPVTGTSEGPWRFVGVTEDTPRGDDGSATLDYYCDQSFPGSRMATSLEFLETTDKPYWTGLPAWVRPLPAIRPDGSSFDTATGTEFPLGTGYGTCDGWNNTMGTSYGLRVGSDGRFLILSCDTALRVACAAPATSP